MKRGAIRAPVLVGAMLIFTILGFIYMVSVVKTTVFSTEGTYLVYATFDDVTGLVEKSNVNMVGIPVGVIASIERVQTEKGIKARVGIRVDDKITLYKGEVGEDGQLRGAASVVRKQSSILGDFFLALAPGAFGEPLKEGDEIPVVIGVSGLDAVFAQMEQMGDLGQRLDRILAHVEEISGGLADVLGSQEGRADLKAMVSNLNDISRESKKIAERTERVSEEIQNIVEDGTISRIAGNIEETSADARKIAQKLESIVAAGDVEKLVDTLANTATQLNNVGVQLNDLVETGITPRVDQLDRIFRNVERFSSYVADFTETNGQTVAQTLGNFRDFSDGLVTLLQRSQGDVESAMSTVKGTLLSAQLSLQKLDESLENVREISAGLREGKGSIGRLLTDDRLVEEIEEIVSDTKGFVKSYTLMQTEVELASSYNFYEQSFKNVLSLRFKPKEDKYYLLQVVDDPRGSISDVWTTIETNDPSLPDFVREHKQETKHELKFSFQFAKKFYFLTGRFGIMENTGGIGLDFDFFKDRLEFQFDLYDFTMNDNPRLRGLVKFEVVNHFFLDAGVDDVLNQRYRDYFFGLGIRFTDEDLKALLLAAPSISP